MSVSPTASVLGPPNNFAASGEGTRWLKPLR